jgi:hypothetical protein
MKIKIEEHLITISRGIHDPRAKNESHLLHQLKIELQRDGYDLIKKLMWKDANLVNYTQHYLRARDKKGTRGIFCIWDTNYAIRNSAEDFNKGEEVCFRIEFSNV